MSSRAEPEARPTSGATRPPTIECRFTWKMADELFNLLGRNVMDGVQIRQKFSKGTLERRNRAMVKRRSLKDGEGEHWKMFVKYPATLMAKTPGSRTYKILEQF